MEKKLIAKETYNQTMEYIQNTLDNFNDPIEKRQPKLPFSIMRVPFPGSQSPYPWANHCASFRWIILILIDQS